MKSNPETLCETNFEATVTRFEFSEKFSGKSKSSSPIPGLRKARGSGSALSHGWRAAGVRERAS